MRTVAVSRPGRARALLAILVAGVVAGCSDVFLRGVRLTIEDYELVGQQRVDRDHFDFVYRARCVLRGPGADAVVAVLESTSPATEVVDGTLRCGPVASRSSAPSLDTFTIRQDRTVPFDPAALRWIVAAVGPLEAAEDEVDEAGAELTRRRYRVAVSNGATKTQAMIALLSSARPTASVRDDRAFVFVRAGEVTASADTVEVVRARGSPLDAAALSLTLQLAPAAAEAAAVVSTLDGVGHPLGGVAIDEIRAGATTRLASDGETGFATLGQGGGELAWKFSRDGYVPVWRVLRVDPGKIAVIPSPRLAERAPATRLPALEDGIAESADGSVRVAFTAGAFPGGADARLTRLDGQSLPLLLPSGWSPLSAFWLEVGEAPATPGRATVTLDQALAPADRAAIVTLDETALAWRVVRTLSGGSESVTEDLAGGGAFAVVVADEGEGAPTTPVPGEPLPAGNLSSPAASGLLAEGRVVPSVRAASPVAQEVTGDATLDLVGDGPIPSGLLLQLAIDEHYVLQDDRTLTLPGVTSFLVAYRRPGSGDPTRASARFPLRPRELFAGDVLAEALLRARISAVSEFSGGVLTAAGGTLSAPGVEVLAAPGDLSDTRPARLDALDPASFGSLLPGDGTPVVAFELGVDGVVTGRTLRASFAPQEPNAAFVLARAVSGGGLEGLEPVERLASDASGILSGTEPAAGERLPGIVRGGRYVLVRVAVRPGLVVAAARSGAGGAISLGVTLEGQPWLSIGASGGSFRLVAPPGAVSGVARELASGDEGRADGALADASAVLALELVTGPTGPRVVAVEPEDGARGVGAVTPVRVRFSEPLAAGSFGPDGLVLRDAGGARIEGALTLDLARTGATLLPSNPLASRTDHTIELAGAIRDAQGLALEGGRSFSFTTAAPAARGAGAQLVIYEPGAETAACDDVPGVDRRAPTVVCATGSQGTADPDVAVVLVNESTGVTSTVRSREDGSFEGFVDAAEDDFVSATFVNTNGTRVQVPVSKQLFDDGSVGLFALGGTVEAELPTGTAEVVVEPGAIAGKTRLRLRAIPPEIQAQVLGDTPPEIGSLLGQGLVLEASGDPLRVAPDVRIDVDEATLVAQGFDLSQPDDATFALVQPREIDGVLGYQILDKLEYEDGKLVSHSPPFPGPNPTAAPEDFGRTLDLCNQNAGAIAVLDELNRALELTLFLLDPSGLSFVTEKIMFWPLTMAIRARPTLFTGKVEEIVPSGICLVGARPLRGALVTVRAVTGPGQLAAQRPGRLDPGESFAIADSKGKYALLLPRVANDEPHAITGQHPRHVGLRVVEPANEFVLPDPFSFLLSPNEFPNPTSVTDLLFPAPLGGTTEQPPQVTVAHVPLLPAPRTPAQVKVFGVHGLGAPTVGLTLVDVKPLGSGSTPSLSDVTITEGASESLGATGVRKSFAVLSDVPALVILKATASVQGSNPAEVEYAVEFGGEPPPPAGGLPVSDPNDRVPPIAVNTWPADGAVGLTPGSPIEVNFSEPVKKDLLTSFTAVNLSGPGASGDLHLELSPDQMRLTVGTGELEPGESYTLTLTSSIEDLAGNDFDGDPSTADADSLSIEFRTAPIVTGTIPIELGASAVMQGIYAFVLDRQGTTEGALVVVDMSDPDEPKEKVRFNLPAFPRDLALVPEYSIVRKAGEPASERTLVAVVGGLVGGSTASQGEFTGGGQYLIVVDVTNPLAPERFASALLTLGASVLVPRVVWSPPFLGYIESGADLQSVGVLNLQTFALGTNTPLAEQAQFPVLGTPGVDANVDGDYTDPGEELPLPCRCPGQLAGKLLGFTIDGTTQKINDLAVDGTSGYFGAAISGGLIRNAAGNPTGPAVSPTYRTFFKAGPIAVPDGDFGFASTDDPKRVRFFAGVPILVDGVPTPTDLALVSVNDLATSRGRVVVLDVTDPFDPKQLNAIDIDPSHGLLQSVELRDDGLFVFATSNDLLLFDPAQLVVQQPPGETHPGIVAKLPGAGSGQRTFMSLSAGLQVVNLGSKSQVVQTAPLLSFVRAPGVEPFDPDDLAADGTLRERVLEKLEFAGAVFPSRATAEAGVPSDLDPPSPLTHYYVRVDAPGSAGGTSGELPVALESLDLGGQPLRNQGLLYPPVRAMDSTSEQQIGESPKEPCDAETKPLDAHRVSDDPADPDYNVFLAGPFVLVIEEMPKQLLDLLRNGSPERIVLWSGFTLRATLDPRIALSNPVGPFASVPDFARSVLKPGAGAFAFTFPGEYLLGPNPAPVVGGATVPASYGAVQAHSGEVRLSDEDLTLDGRGLEIHWTRTYGAQDLYDGPLGRGWDFYYNQRLRELSPESFGFGSIPLVDRGDPAKNDVARGGDVVFYDGEGEAVLFRNAGNSPPSEAANDPLAVALGFTDTNRVRTFYLPQRGVFELLFQFVDGRFARLTRDGRQFWYDPDGRLTTIYDRYETNAIKLRYNQRGQLVRILDELDRPIEVGWYRAASDAAFGAFDVVSADPKTIGHIARVRDYSSREVRYEYDANGYLDRRVGPTITQSALGGFAGDDEVRYLYTSCEDPDESASALRGTIEGGASGTPIVSATSYSSGARDQVSSLSTASGSVGVSLPGTNSAAALEGKRATFQGPDGLSIEYLFNELGQPERVTHGGVRSFQQTFNPDGLLERMEFPEGNAVEYVYDSGNLALRARANLLETHRIPVGAGSPGADPTYVSLSPHDTRYNVPAGPQTDFAGKSYEIVIDGFGRDADRIEYPNGDKATFQRNPFGQVEVETSADGIVTTTIYNGDGWPETVKSGSVPAEQFTYGGLAGLRGLPSRMRDARSIPTDFVWNERDQLVSSERAGRKDEWGYDRIGRQEAQATKLGPGGVVLPGGIVPEGRTLVERRKFRASGFLERVTVENVEVQGSVGPVTFELFPDAAQRLSRIEFPSGEVKNFFYDALGQLEHTETGSHAEFYTYDDNGQLESRRIGNATDAYVLDGHRRVKELQHPGGGKSFVTYDGNDAVLTERFEDPDFGVLSDREFVYDVRGRQEKTRVLLGSGGVSESKLAFDRPQRTLTRTEANGAQIVSTWDDAGRPATVTTPYGTRTLTLDENGNPLSNDRVESGRTYAVSATFDDLDQQLTLSDGVGPLATYEPRFDGAVRRTIDAAGRAVTHTLSILGEPLAIEKPNGVREEREYDARRRLRRIADEANHASTIGFDTSLRLVDTLMPGGLSTVFSGFNLEGNPERVTLSSAVQIDHVVDVRGRPEETTYGAFADFPSRQETFAYDSLDRVRRAEYPGGSVEFDFDLLATLREVRTEIGGTLLRVRQTPDASGYRTQLEYPTVATFETRDPGGRLLSLSPSGGAPVVGSTSFVAAEIVGSRTLGGGALRFDTDVDGRKRPRFRRYTNGAGEVLIDLRYGFDAVDDLVARQRVERGGRTDLYTYDAGHRLTRADHGVRPAISGQGPRAFPGFTPSPSLPGAWAPGLYSRQTFFDDLDVITGAATVAPQPVAVPPFATSYGAFDVSLHTGEIDGFVRPRDALGNTAASRLQVRDAGLSEPIAIEAELEHDQSSRLARVTRADGATIENQFDAFGLRTRRTITCPAASVGCEPSDRFYLYHRGLLLEEYEGGVAPGSLLARYYYDDDGELLAMDRRGAGAGLARFYFLSDLDGSIVGLADATGRLVERVLYDAWGEPTIERADDLPPRVRRITVGTDGSFLVEFSERVLPRLQPGEAPDATESAYADLSAAFVLRPAGGGNALSASVEYAEAEPGFDLGTVIRVRPTSAGAQDLVLEIAADAVRDEWNRSVAAAAIPVRSGSAPGTVAFTNPAAGSTAPERIGRSQVGSPFLFHGEYFDYETGLLYLRSRFYQPSTGLFLERDPKPYADSVNAYAGMMNNPVAFRDPSGASIVDVLKVAGRAVARAASAGGRATVRGVRSVGRAAGNLGRGFARKATALVNRLDRAANPVTGQLDEALNGSYAAAAQATRQVDSVGPRARQLAANFRASRSVSTPAPTEIRAGTGGAARQLDDATEETPLAALAQTEELAPPRPPAPLGADEIRRIQRANRAFNRSDAGQRVLQQFKVNRANRAIELHPELEGVNPRAGGQNCVACENALAIRKTEGIASINADDVETPLRNGDNAFNPRETVFHQALDIRDVVARVKAAGPGAHFHIRGLRGQGVIGHRFGVVNHNGAVHFLDPQLESFANLKNSGYLSFYLMRYR